MSFAAPYPHEERRKSRALIKKLDTLKDDIDLMARGKRPFNSSLVAGVAAITDTSDLESQHRALSDLADGRRKAHLDQLIRLAPDDLTAFAEVMSPAEPPPPHLIYIDERLMEIEAGDRDRLMLSMPPGHAKDLCVETPVMMGDGAWKRLGDIELGDMVMTMHGRPREVLAVHEQGVRPVLKIVTASGKSVRAHPEHLFLTPADWVAAQDLDIGMTLSTPKEFEIAGAKGRSIDEFALAGYLLARCFVAGRVYNKFKTLGANFRCDDPTILADVKQIVTRLGFFYTQDAQTVYNRRSARLIFDETCRKWMHAAGLFEINKKMCRIPEWVFRGTNEQVGAFLGAIVSCDFKLMPGYKGAHRELIPLRIQVRENEGLCDDLRRLLLRFGVKARMLTVVCDHFNYAQTHYYRLMIEDTYSQIMIGRRMRLIGEANKTWKLPHALGDWTHPTYHSDKIVAITPDGETPTRCLTVEEDHSFIAAGLVVHNSTHASRFYPAWYLGRRERRIYLQAGHSKDFARTEFGRKTKDIVESDAYRSVFPGVGVRYDAKAADDWILTNGNRYVTKGVGEGVSGFRSTNNAVDDPYKDYAAAQSPVQRQKIWDWFVNDFMTRLLPQGNAFIISTRWHIDDLIGRLSDMMAAGELSGQAWDIINLPVFCVEPENDPLGRALGEEIWPDFYSKEVLLRQKSLSSPSNWACLYEGNPVPDEGNIIKKLWLTARYQTPPMIRVGATTTNTNNPGVGHNGGPELPDDRDPEISNRDPSNLEGAGTLNPQIDESENRVVKIAPPYKRTVVSVDSAEKENQRADFTAITVWREAIDGRHYLVDAHRERMEFPKLCERVEFYAKQWGAEFVLMEEKGAGNQYIQHTAALPEGERMPFIVVGINPGRDGKVFRMDSVTPYFQALRVVLPERAPWLSTLERELLMFPGGKNDDYADSISQYLKWARDTAPVRRGSKKLRGVSHSR